MYCLSLPSLREIEGITSKRRMHCVAKPVYVDQGWETKGEACVILGRRTAFS